jgi:hypothetical protein
VDPFDEVVNAHDDIVTAWSLTTRQHAAHSQSMNYLIALLSLLEGQSLDLVLYDFREDRNHLFGDFGSTVDAL